MAEVPGKCLDDPRISTDIQCRYGRFLHVNPYNQSVHNMRGSRKFCQRGSKFDDFFIFFLVDEGIEDPNTAINRLSSARQRIAI